MTRYSLSPAGAGLGACPRYPGLADSPWATCCRPLARAWVLARDTQGSRTRPGLHAVARWRGLGRDNSLNLKSTGEHIGFSAQAVEQIIPEAVTNNDPILWTMLNAIKEHQKEIDQQREIQALTKRLSMYGRLKAGERPSSKPSTSASAVSRALLTSFSFAMGRADQFC